MSMDELLHMGRVLDARAANIGAVYRYQHMAWVPHVVTPLNDEPSKLRDWLDRRYLHHQQTAWPTEEAAIAAAADALEVPRRYAVLTAEEAAVVHKYLALEVCPLGAACEECEVLRPLVARLQVFAEKEETP